MFQIDLWVSAGFPDRTNSILSNYEWRPYEYALHLRSPRSDVDAHCSVHRNSILRRCLPALTWVKLCASKLIVVNPTSSYSYPGQISTYMILLFHHRTMYITACIPKTNGEEVKKWNRKKNTFWPLPSTRNGERKHNGSGNSMHHQIMSTSIDRHYILLYNSMNSTECRKEKSSSLDERCCQNQFKLIILILKYWTIDLLNEREDR